MKKFAIIVLSFAVILGLIGGFIWYKGYCMRCLPEGELLNESKSFNGEYAIQTYIYWGSLATSDPSIRGELIWDNGKRSKNIYWNPGESEAQVNWIDNNTVEINGHQMKLPNQVFDGRRH